jgi:glycosyltransferase involved in cell wall biosynthesis
LVRDGVAMARTTVVYDGIDVGQMCPDRDPEVVRSAYGIPRGAPVIGIVGGVKRWKGQHVVVRATAKLAAMWPDVRCLVVGSGVPGETYFEELLQLSRDLGLERNVIFTGFEPRPADLMNAMDVVVHASITPEPFGLVNIEAMALRKPVVATRIGGPIEIFDDGRDGLLVAPSDPAALAERLATLLADPVLRRRIGESARTKVEEKFTMGDTVRAIESVYDEVCQ